MIRQQFLHPSDVKCFPGLLSQVHVCGVEEPAVGHLLLNGAVALLDSKPDRDHEHGNVADRGVGDDPLAGFKQER